MAYGKFNAGPFSMHVTVYNPSSEFSRAVATALVERIIDTFHNMTEEEVLAIIPTELAERVRMGEVRRDVGIGEHPIDPQNAIAEMQIAGILEGKRK